MFMNNRRIWIVRHANRLDFERTEWFNDAEFPYDPPLAESGLTQAKDLAEQLATSEIKHIFTSPYLRAIQTAYPVAQKGQLPIKMEYGLREWLCQEWTDGMPSITPVSRLYSQYPLIEKDYESIVYPSYPETAEMVLQRSSLTIKHIIEQYQGNVFIVAHKISINGLLIALLGDQVPITDLNLPLGGMRCLVMDKGKWIIDN
jgi:broad specificity phosphatase PhoE